PERSDRPRCVLWPNRTRSPVPRCRRPAAPGFASACPLPSGRTLHRAGVVLPGDLYRRPENGTALLRPGTRGLSDEKAIIETRSDCPFAAAGGPTYSRPG